jgi:hypothetical protein
MAPKHNLREHKVSENLGENNTKSADKGTLTAADDIPITLTKSACNTRNKKNMLGVNILLLIHLNICINHSWI